MRTTSNAHHIAFLLLIVFLVGQWGCVRWHRRPLLTDSLPDLVDKEREVFLVTYASTGGDTWRILQPVLTRDSIHGMFIRYPEQKAARLLNANEQRDYRQQKNRVLLHGHPEFHPSIADSAYQGVPLSGLNGLESIDLDVGATIALSIVATFGVFAVIGIIILATKSSCPFVYAQGPDGYHLEGEIFSGSIYPQLQRHDHLPLHYLAAVNNEYRIRLANKAHEIQRTDLLELIAVDHAPGTTVLFDRDGQARTISEPMAPISAADHRGRSVLNELRADDDQPWRGDAGNDRPDADELIEMTFTLPPHASHGDLLIKARNTFWADHLYGLFLDEFGTYTPRLHALNRGRTAEELRGWMSDQYLPLAVEMEVAPGKWERVGQFELAGPIAWREDVMRIDLGSIQSDRVKLRLSTGFLFWEIDRVALDVTAESPVAVMALRPQRAIDQDGTDVLPALLVEDGNLLVQPELDDMTEIVLPATEIPEGKIRSFFLHAAGHYEILRDPKPHTPSLLYLRSFEEPGAFSRYSRDRLHDTRELEFHQPL